MKKAILPLLFLTLSGILQAQNHIKLVENKLTQFVFHAAIKSFKVGVPEHLVTQIEDNVLYLQPVSVFPESNMTVITDDDCYYSFFLQYADSTNVFNYFFRKADALFTAAVDENINQKASKTLPQSEKRPSLARILDEKGYIYNYNSVKTNKVSLSLKGVYISSDKIYFRIEITNNSSVNYDIDLVTFYVRTRQKNKTASEEILQKIPISNYPATITVVPAKSSQEIVYEFDKFTIGSNKLLYIDIAEVSGDRTLSLPVNDNFIINAKSF